MATADTISLYRVIGWEPSTQKEYNCGIFMAADRGAAIRKAQRVNPNSIVGLVLDAVVFTTTTKEKWDGLNISHRKVAR